MLTLMFLLVAQNTPSPPTPNEIKELRSQIEQGLNSYIQEGRRWSGTLSVSDVTQGSKPLRDNAVKADGKRYLIQNLDGNKKPIIVEIFRTFGDIRQVLTLTIARNTGKLVIYEEVYRKKGEPALPYETNREFAYEAPIAIPLFPVPGIQYLFLDFLDSPACHVTSIETRSDAQQKIVRVSYVVNKEVNDKLPVDQQVNQVQKGWIEFRPDQMWTIHRSEYQLAGVRRSPARSWKAEFIYDPVNSATPGKMPVIKEIRLETTDQNAKAGEKSDLKLVKQLYKFDFKHTPSSLTDNDFSPVQFGLKERTASDWLADVAAQEKADAELKAKIAALPKDAIKLVDTRSNIDPWIVLIGGIAAFIVLVLWVFWSTSRPAKQQVT